MSLSEFLARNFKKLDVNELKICLTESGCDLQWVISSAFICIGWSKQQKNTLKISSLWSRELKPVNSHRDRKQRCSSDCKIRCVLSRSERLVIFPARTEHFSSSAHQFTPPSQLLFWTVPCQLWPFILGLPWNAQRDLALYNISNFRYRARSKRPAWQNSSQQKKPFPFLGAYAKLR